MGFCDKPEAISQADINKRELDIIGSRMIAFQFEPVAANIAAGKYRLDGLVTTFAKFSEMEKVFQNMEQPDPAVKKTVIIMIQKALKVMLAQETGGKIITIGYLNGTTMPVDGGYLVK